MELDNEDYIEMNGSNVRCTDEPTRSTITVNYDKISKRTF